MGFTKVEFSPVAHSLTSEVLLPETKTHSFGKAVKSGITKNKSS